MKKFLSILLTIVMLASMMPMAIAEYTDGTYVGTGAGMHSAIKVEVVVEGGKIAKVTILEQDETVGIADPAFEQIPAAIVAAGSPEVDVVAHATLTSNGINDALKQAAKEVQ